MSERFFVPSQYHLRLMEQTQREFAWRGQPFKEWQSALRERLVGLLGGFPDVCAPLDVEEIEREETDAYVRRKIVFVGEDRAHVPAHLLVPKKTDVPVPAMVCLQGHSPGMHISIGAARNDDERDSIKGDRDFALQAVRNGCVALAIEQRCFGERVESLQKMRSDHGCFDAVMHSLMLGRTMMGERVTDLMRGIDLLQQMPEVDPQRIGCMGNSGGGTVTFYGACVDQRIAVAVPSCSFCTYADSLMRIYHCADNYIPGILKVAEMGELAGLIAPRKLVAVAGQEDEIFPIHGVRKAFAAAQDIYRAAGCPENIKLVVGPGGHRFYAGQSWPLIRRMFGLE